MKKVIIVGGSYAGVKAGKTLHKIFKKNDDVEITLIDKNPFHTMMTELHEVAGHRTEEDSIRIDLRKIFKGRKVKIVTDEVDGCSFNEKKLIGKKGEYKFDYLIIAMGSQANFFGVKGADQNSHKLWSYEDALKLREHIENMFKLASSEENEAERKRLLTFAVCGGGFTGVEMVGELGEAKKHLSREYGIDESEVTIYNIEAMPTILNMLDSEKLINKIENKYYKKLGITLLKNSPIVEVNKDSFLLKDGTEIQSHTLIWTAGIMCVEDAQEFCFDKGKGARICVNEYMQALNEGKPCDGIYAAGDCAFYQDEDGVMPQIVEAAEQSGHTAAMNIGAQINGTDMHKHKQNYHGFMVSVGSRRAVAQTGFSSSGWFAMFIKHFVNVYYQFLVAGFMQVFNYLRHEIFNIKNKRSFVGGHFSKRNSNFWQVPLRIWLGFMWLTEGVVKIAEGWFKEPKVVETVNFLSGYTPEAANGAADAVTAASGAAEAVVDTVTAASGAVAEAAPDVAEVAMKLPGIFQWVVDHKPSGYGEALIGAPKFMVWIMNHWVAPIEVPVQIIMVLAEIIIGLCFMGGLFTFPAAVVSVLFAIGISLTGMADITMMWYFFGGFAIMMGAGRAFGLDYYVMPWLKRWWSGTKFASKNYLYVSHLDDE
ncbi:MAG: FAD-dependent oxidoreductase [Eubacteriales bacterium]